MFGDFCQLNLHFVSFHLPNWSIFLLHVVILQDSRAALHCNSPYLTLELQTDRSRFVIDRAEILCIMDSENIRVSRNKLTVQTIIEYMIAIWVFQEYNIIATYNYDNINFFINPWLCSACGLHVVLSLCLSIIYMCVCVVRLFPL